MQINEAKIYNFGKLQNKSFQFAPGINVIYGENESGKSTLHEFLNAMLFGMEKNKGRAAAGDSYVRYTPWHAPSYYSGALRFSVDYRPFYLERNFYHKDKTEILRNELDGEELSIAYGDLSVLLGGIGKEAFGNTYDIPQSGAATGKELSNILAEYLSDMAESGDAGIQVTKAQNALLTRKKELNQDLKRLKEAKNQELQELFIEKDILERDARALQRNIVEAEREINSLKRIQAEEENENRQLQKKKMVVQEESIQRKSGRIDKNAVMMAAVAVFAGMLGNVVYWLLVSYSRTLFYGIEILLGIILLGLLGFYWNLRAGNGRQQEQEVQATDIIKVSSNYGTAAVIQAEKMLKNLRDSLAEKETRRYNITERMEQVRLPGTREQELAVDIQALELAASEIVRLSREFCEEIEDELNAAVSGWVSKLTNGKYDSVSVSNEGKLKVRTDGLEVPPEALSRGALEQIYLALRLAVGDIVTREESMPIFLDETFSMYDDKRLAHTLQALVTKKEQIFLFTCQHREMELMDRMGITYHKVVLE